MNEKQKKIRVAPQRGPQWDFCASPADIVIYGGAAGSGKTWALVFEGGRNINVNGYGGIIFRRTAPQIRGEGGLWEESIKLYQKRGGKPREHLLNWRFKSGASISFSHLQYENNKYDHQGKQYAFIGFDQLEHFTSGQFWYMVSRNRSTCGVRPYIRGTVNPDPDSFVKELISWWLDDDNEYPDPEKSGVIRWFIRSGEKLIWADSREELTEKYPGTDPKSFTFIAAKLTDNKILMEKDPSYKASLDALPLVERSRLRDGSWKIRPAAGLFFRKHYFEVIGSVNGDAVTTVRAWDRAGTRKGEKGNTDPDFTAGIRMSRLHDGTFVIEDLVHMLETPHNVNKALKNAASRDGYDTNIEIFQDPGSAGKWEAQETVKMLSGYTVNVTTASSTKGKIKFAEPFSAQCEAGNVKVVRAEWNEIMFAELENFPDGKHDDIVDACSLAFHALTHEEYILM